MQKFIPLKELRDRVWPLAVTRNLATDMTGISLPILDFSNEISGAAPNALFMLYYAVPTESNTRKPNQITRPYALMALDLIEGKLTRVEPLRSGETSIPLIGQGVDQSVFDLSNDDRRNLQNLFFARCDETAQIYADQKASPVNKGHLTDLLDLYQNLMEPPLVQDYETYGKPFFSWLRENAKGEADG